MRQARNCQRLIRLGAQYRTEIGRQRQLAPEIRSIDLNGDEATVLGRVVSVLRRL